MPLNPQSRARFNLEGASIMAVEPHLLGMDVLVEILSRFGAKNIHRCHSAEEARAAAEKFPLDLIVVDAMAGEGHEFVRWLRRTDINLNAITPVILISGHTPKKFVAESRDCGAHFVMTKPLTPSAVLERILWIAREGRKFVMCDSYMGPDRRFKNTGPPPGTTGRRKTDASGEIGRATMPNLDQSLIDNLVRPSRIDI
jgi:DNA-binding response OmpR family regulator